MSKNNVIIVSVPFTDTTAPIMAPALLKSAVKQAGFECTAFDLNAIVVNIVKNHKRKLELLDFFYFERVAPGLEHAISDMFKNMVTTIMAHNPDTVALSLLHYQCQVAAKWLCFELRKQCPDIKIIIGGTGITGQLASNDTGYAELLRQQNLIDHYIYGDGDLSLVECLKGNTDYSGIDSTNWVEIKDLDSVPYPNYDDYNFALYESSFIGILGSRGCVRQCTFCDVHEHWSKFRWRNGDLIFQEMLYQNQKYGTRFFKFQDSLINGNVIEYKKLITRLAQHNRENPDNSFRWASYFIFRPADLMDEEQWKLTAESGAYVLSVGVESLVDRVRYHIKKKFNNQDIDFALSMAKKYQVKIFFITLVGYATETEEDHQEALAWLRANKHYAGDPIYRLSVGGTLAILPNTWLDRNQKELGVVWKNGTDDQATGKNHLWLIPATNNTYETRVQRLNELIQVGQECGFDIHRAIIDPQKEMEDMIHLKMSNVYEHSTHI
jgi:hypothetical protein